MRTHDPISSTLKATTACDLRVPQRFRPSRRAVATAIIGAALISYLVHKTLDARGRLESLATLAQLQGDLTESDTLIIAQILAL